MEPEKLINLKKCQLAVTGSARGQGLVNRQKQ
jgi:hypothetical protein